VAPPRRAYFYFVKKKRASDASAQPVPYTRALRQAARETAFWRQHFPAMASPAQVPAYLAHGRFREGNLTDEQLGWLASRLQTIHMLDIYEAPITAAGLEHLTQVACLTELRLKDCAAVGDDALTPLARIPGLELLHVGGTAVTLDGLAAMPPAPTLKTIFLDSDLPPADIRDRLLQLAETLPGCDVVVNHLPPHHYLELP
jgi:hypothetical protein